MSHDEIYAEELGTTPDVIQDLFKGLAKGLSLEEASILHRLPYEEVQRLHDADKSFALNVRRARIHLKVAALDNMLSESGRKTGAATRLLERLFPHEEKQVTPEKVSKIISALDSTPLVDPRTVARPAPTPRPKESLTNIISDRLDILEAQKRPAGAQNVLRPAPAPTPPPQTGSYSVDTF